MQVRTLTHTVFAVAALVVSTLLSAHAVASTDYSALYEKVRPSVVKVSTQTFEFSSYGIEVKPGVGTGILLEDDLILTAAHVVDDVDRIMIEFSDAKKITAQAIVTLEETDVALLKLSEPHPDPVPAVIGNSSLTRVGEPVVVIGYPFGFEISLSVGYLSGRVEKNLLADGTPNEFLQTDSAINPGNSGGPLLNLHGEVIGVVSFMLTKSGGFDGVGFASATNSSYKAVMNSSAFLTGLEGLELNESQARALNLPKDGILVQRVLRDSIADKIGLKAGTINGQIGQQEMRLGGDLILDVQCPKCESAGSEFDLTRVVDNLVGDQSLELTVYRAGNRIKLVRDVDAIAISDSMDYY